MANKLDPVARVTNKIHQLVFDASNGRLGASMKRVEWVLLTTTGRTSGEPRRSMVELTRRGTTRRMHAREAEGDERDALWAQVVSTSRDFERYQAKAGRQIPVVVLEPVP